MATLFEEYRETNLEFEVSENFGNAGIEKIRGLMYPAYRAEDIGVCRAGWRLFAIVKIGKELVVVGCVDRLKPVLGYVRGERFWRIEWDMKKINLIRDSRHELYGCWGGIGVNSGFNDIVATQKIF